MTSTTEKEIISLQEQGFLIHKIKDPFYLSEYTNLLTVLWTWK